jgi:predicted glycoside hydrolase/deacetylase ChbG (UPF0249 family)
MDASRHLLVIADDFGIGPETTRGILDLARRGLVTGSVLLVNSPYAESAVREFRRAGEPLELGWHPCLTIDRPVTAAGCVPSLVDGEGRFLKLGRLLGRLLTGRLRAGEIDLELQAQYDRFVDLVGRAPTLVNAHHHVSVFPVIGDALARFLSRTPERPYLRRVVEPTAALTAIGDARVKRTLLSLLGRWRARKQVREGFPGAPVLAGIAGRKAADEKDFFVRRLMHTPGAAVELMCHPGLADETIAGRDEMREQRVAEYRLLADPSFEKACAEAGFTRVRPSRWRELGGGGSSHAA